MSVPQQDVELASRQRMSRFRSVGPPAETSLGEPFQDQEKSLAVVDEKLQCRSPAIGEDEQGSHQGILVQSLTAQSDQPINAFAKIDWLHGQ
jgi:hypothetical protein